MTFDLDAFIAEKASKAGPFEFTFGGQEFSTLTAQPDIRVAALYDRGDIIGCVKAMLGDDEYDRFISQPALLTREGLFEIICRWAAHAGSSPGESSASTGSSSSTAKRSRPTSKKPMVKR